MMFDEFCSSNKSPEKFHAVIQKIQVCCGTMSCFSEWGLSDKRGYRDNDPSVHRRHVLGWPPLWLLAVAVILALRKSSSEPLFQWIYTVKWDEAHPMSTDRLTDGWAQGDNEQWNWSLWQTVITTDVGMLSFEVHSQWEFQGKVWRRTTRSRQPLPTKRSRKGWNMAKRGVDDQ